MTLKQQLNGDTQFFGGLFVIPVWVVSTESQHSAVQGVWNNTADSCQICHGDGSILQCKVYETTDSCQIFMVLDNFQTFSVKTIFHFVKKRWKIFG